MRIAVVNRHPTDAVGGSELQCDIAARWLAERGHTVRYVGPAVVSPGPAPSTEGSAPAGRGYDLVRVENRPEAILAALRSEPVDVVYWRFNRLGLAEVLRGLRRDGVPLVLATAHIDDVSPWPARPWPRGLGPRGAAAELRTRLRERRSWSALRGVAAVAAQREDFLGRIPVPLQMLTRNVMDPELEPFDRPRPYVAWVGSLQQRKRPEAILPVAAALEASGVDVLVAGQVREDRYARLLADPGRPSTLHHLGLVPRPRVSGLLASARALLLTAHEEGLSNVLIQAAWYGTPVVSLEHDPDGLIDAEGLGQVCGGSADAFVRAAVAAALRPPTDAERTARAASARALFSPANLERLEELLARAARCA